MSAGLRVLRRRGASACRGPIICAVAWIRRPARSRRRPPAKKFPTPLPGPTPAAVRPLLGAAPAPAPSRLPQPEPFADLYEPHRPYVQHYTLHRPSSAGVPLRSRPPDFRYPWAVESNAANRDNASEEARVLPLALFAVEHNSKKRLLFDVSSRNIRGITSMLFPDAFVEFESCGWLLMVRRKPFYFQEQVVFLVHPSTGRRIDMPVLRSPNSGYFVFYVDPRGSGTPLVVACIQIMSVVPTVHVACPGDVYWCVHKHTCQLHPSEAMCRSIHNTLIMDVALVGTQAVYLCEGGRREESLHFPSKRTW
ncbi:uncharacterized protein LOC123409356 [Hordeum vulgare subsp. vulgare]|uniref:uncharacterized protein LOC123409356 n=1 Tax=Hordeum vulgare subsp. vulgare TaxID=112509 RepID=UPI001D1A4B01|nr:uncharacterized protein LOC123409356 [Hordeum vulgare subsp. vulgare]